MRHIEWEHRLQIPVDSGKNHWHTLTLDVEGHIQSSDRTAMHVLGPQTDALTGNAIKSVVPDLPFSESTPGYNMAYAVFHGAKGAKVRRTVLATNGQRIPVETILSYRNHEGDRSITFRFRPACP